MNDSDLSVLLIDTDRRQTDLLEFLSLSAGYAPMIFNHYPTGFELRGNRPISVAVIGLEHSSQSLSKGLALCRTLWTVWPSLAVVLLGRIPSGRDMTRVVRELRVVDFLAKPLRESAQFSSVVQLAANRHHLFSQLWGESSLANSARKDLTPRQGEVAELLSTGLEFEQIAALLGLSEGSVRNCVAAVYEKIGVRSRVQAVMRLNGLI